MFPIETIVDWTVVVSTFVSRYVGTFVVHPHLFRCTRIFRGLGRIRSVAHGRTHTVELTSSGYDYFRPTRTVGSVYWMDDKLLVRFLLYFSSPKIF